MDTRSGMPGCPKYDVITMSYYPCWLQSDYTETIDELGHKLQDMATCCGKEVMVAAIAGWRRTPGMMLKSPLTDKNHRPIKRLA